MAFSRRLGTICIVGASWLVAVGCDDNEDQVFPRAGAGEGGEAPGGGKSSVAGSQSNGGKAGASAGSESPLSNLSAIRAARTEAIPCLSSHRPDASPA